MYSDSSPFQPSYRSFWNDIGKIFTFPLQSRGVGVILIGGVCIGIGRTIAGASMWGWPLAVIIYAYLVSYEFKIINAVANGEEDVPPWPDFQGMFDSLIMVFCCYAICFGPAIGSLVLGIIMSAAQSPAGPFLILLSIPLFLLATFYFPMAYLKTVLFASPAAALNVGFGFSSIGRVFGEYIVVFLLTALFMGLPILIENILVLFLGNMAGGFARYGILFVANFLSVPFLLAKSYMFGRLYFTCEDRLNWFPGTDRRSMAGPLPQVYGQPQGHGGTQAYGQPQTGVQGPPVQPGPVAPVQGGEWSEPRTRGQSPDFGTAKYIPSEDPFHAFREERMAEKEGDKASDQDDLGEIFDRAKKPATPESDELASPETHAGYDTAARRRPTGAYPAQDTGARRRPTGTYPTQDTGARRRPTGAHPAGGPQQSGGTGMYGPQNPQPPAGDPQAPGGGFIPPPSQIQDDHAGPVRFAPDVQALVDQGEYAEAKNIVSQMRESARNRGNLAEMSFYRKQIDMIEMMERI